MKILLHVVIESLAFLTIGVARADTLACQLPSGFDASEINECGAAGKDNGGPTPRRPLKL